MSSNSSNNKRIAKNTIFLYIRMLFVLFVSLYTTRVVLRTLGVEDFGINNVVCGFVSMFSFFNTSMSNGIQRFLNYQKGLCSTDGEQKVFSTSIIIQFCFAIGLLIILESFGLWYMGSKMVIPADRLFAAQWIYQFSVISMFLVMMQAPFSALILAHERMDYYAVVSIIDVLLKLLVVIFLPYIPADKLILYGLMNLTVVILNFLMYFIYCKKKINEVQFSLKYEKSYIKEMLSFTGWNLCEMFSFMMKGQGLNLVLNSFFGPVVNASRGVANMVISAIQGFSVNIVVAFRPQTVESYAQQNYDRVQKLMFSLSKISYILLFTLAFPLSLEIDTVLHLWLGDTVPDYTIAFTVLVLVDMVFSSLNTPLSQVAQAVGDIKVYQIVRSIVVISVIPLSYLALYLGADPTAVFITCILITLINQPVSMYLLNRIFRFSYRQYFRGVILPCIIFSILIFPLPFVGHLFISYVYVRLFAVCFITLVCACVIAYYIVLDKSERELITKFIRRKK